MNLVYTTLFNGYDKLRPPIPSTWKYIAFSDKQCPGWHTVIIPPKKDVFRQTRYIWHNVHQLVEFDISIIIAAHQKITFDLDKYAETHKGFDLVIYRNPYYKNIAEEANAVIINKQAPEKEVMKAYNYVMDRGFPIDFGLFALSGTMRKNNKKTRKFYSILSDLTQELCHREQLLFPYVWWKYGKDLKIKVIETPYYQVYDCNR